MPFTIVRQDLTKMKVDAIVNSSNTKLLMGGGVSGAIFKAAGAHELQAACNPLAPITTGSAVITPGFSLPAKHIIHTVGPIYHRSNPDESALLLRSAYLSSLQLAIDNNCESIAFPLISSGIYGYPKKEALQVAKGAIQDFLEEHELNVYLVVFDKAAFAISESLLGEVESFIDEHYVNLHEVPRYNRSRDRFSEAELRSYVQSRAPQLERLSQAYQGRIEDLVQNLDEPFSTTVLRLIDAKGMTDVEVYRRANLDRRLFSRIRGGKDYLPSKRTAIALAIALKLTLPETNDLLERAGYALSRSRKFDVIVEYFIRSQTYDIFAINEVLFSYDQQLLGG